LPFAIKKNIKFKDRKLELEYGLFFQYITK
jgi:hypothetical protein